MGTINREYQRKTDAGEFLARKDIEKLGAERAYLEALPEMFRVEGGPDPVFIEAYMRTIKRAFLKELDDAGVSEGEEHDGGMDRVQGVL